MAVAFLVAGFFLPIDNWGRNQHRAVENQGGISFVPFCQILQQPSKYDTKEIVTEGVAGYSFHQAMFFDPECPLPKYGGAARLRFDDSYKMGQKADKKEFKLLDKEGAIRAKYRGYFVATGGPFGPEGSPFEFRILEILDMQKLTAEYRQKYSIGTGQTDPNKAKQ